MKKVFLIFTLTLFSIVNAQKRTVLVAGSVGYDNIKLSNSTTDYKNNTLNLSLKIGYQFSNNLTFGIESTISNTNSEMKGKVAEATSSDSKGSGLNIGPFLRYSKSLGGIFFAYSDLGLGIISEKNTYSDSPDFPNKGIYAYITPALAINIKKGFCLNFSLGGLGYKSTKDGQVEVETRHTFYFNFGQQPTIGISKNF